MEGRLRAHSAHFLRMVSLIPAHYYVSREQEDEQVESLSMGKSKGETRFWRNKKTAQLLKRSRKVLKNTSTRQEDMTQANTKEGSVNKSEDGTTSGKQLSVERLKSASLAELQDRLHRKIEEVALKRSTVNKDSKNQERKRRRGKESEGGPGRKQQRLEEKQKRKESVKEQREARQKRAAVKVAGAGGDVKTNANDPQFSFNQFDFNQASKTRGKRKNYHSLITKAEVKKKRLEELTAYDKERGVVAQEKEKWSKAVQMARGEKLKDDPALLKKTMKRLERRKQSHKRKWGERVRAEHQRRDTKQKKRQQNISERIDKIKAKKTRKRAKKKGIV